MENFDLLSFVAGVIAAAIPVGAAAVASLWGTLKAKAEATPSPLDDRLIEFVEAIADRIIAAKLSDPEDPELP